MRVGALQWEHGEAALPLTEATGRLEIWDKFSSFDRAEFTASDQVSLVRITD